MDTSFKKKYLWKPWRNNAFQLFDNEKLKLEVLLSQVNYKIYFFGSSSIEGVGGKGFIDIYISTDSIEKVKDVLVDAGYEYRPNAGSSDRLFFQRYDSSVDDVFAYHVHLTTFGNTNLIESIAFRDFLRADAAYAKKYSGIKKQASEAAIQQPSQEKAKKRYMEIKTPLINEIMEKVRVYVKNAPEKYENL